MIKKPEERIRRYLSELKKINLERMKLLMKISATKTLLVDKRDYAGIVYIIRFLDYKNRNRLFTKFLTQYPGDFLFVMAFADAGSSSYEEAEKTAETAYENFLLVTAFDDAESYNEKVNYIKDEVSKERDRVLCLFLDEYNSKEDLQYVHDIIESCDLKECSWMTAYKRVVSEMAKNGI